jgi:hypothetical protein
MNGVEMQFSFTNIKIFQATFMLQVALVVKSTFLNTVFQILYRLPWRKRSRVSILYNKKTPLYI